jgi:hypothetical protein
MNRGAEAMGDGRGQGREEPFLCKKARLIPFVIG